jgi:hypothetical protein
VEAFLYADALLYRSMNRLVRTQGEARVSRNAEFKCLILADSVYHRPTGIDKKPTNSIRNQCYAPQPPLTGIRVLKPCRPMSTNPLYAAVSSPRLISARLSSTF